jgi:hypothetical protein
MFGSFYLGSASVVECFESLVPTVLHLLKLDWVLQVVEKVLLLLPAVLPGLLLALLPGASIHTCQQFVILSHDHNSCIVN